MQRTSVKQHRTRDREPARSFFPAASARLLIFNLLIVSAARAQEDEESPPPVQPDVSVRISTRAEALGQFASGKWSVVGVEVVNHTEEPVEIQSVSWFKSEPGLQFGRRISVPPRARRRTWYPVLVPKTRRGVRSLDLKSQVVRVNGSSEVQIKASEERVESQPLSLPRLPRLTGYLSDLSDREIQIGDRVRVLLGRGPMADHWMTMISDPSLPALADALQPAETLVVTGDRISRDASALQAVKSWVLQGGTLWLMVDQMKPETVDLLLGDAAQFDTVDSLDLTRFEIVRTGSAETTDNAIEFDKPVRLERTIIDGGEVTHTVNGWPAAVRIPFGKGQIVCTLLEIEAWIIPWPHWIDEQRPAVPTGPVDYHQISRAALDLTDMVFRRRIEEPIGDEPLDEYLVSRVGYRVPGRSTVLVILGTYCLAIVICGLILARRNQPALGWAVYPALTLVAASILLVIGNQSYAQPSQVVTSQVILVEPGESEMSVKGRMAVYSDSTATRPLAFDEGGRFIPDRKGLKTERWRLVRSDVDAWHAENLQLPPGLRTGEFSQEIPLEQKIEVRGTFDAGGFRGIIEKGPLSQPEDATIATRTAFTIPVRIRQDGSFSAASSRVLPPGEFLGDGVLSDEQQRRQKLIRRMLSTERRSRRYPSRPVLFAWVDPVRDGITLPHDQFDGIALAAIPIQFQRPAAGTHVTVPSPFLDYRSQNRSGKGTSAAFKNALGVWTENSFKSNSSLRFQVPESLLPFEATRGTLQIRITAPLRTVRVSSGLTEPDVELGSEKGPVGTRTFRLESKESLELDESGGLFVVINVGDVILEGGKKAALGTQDLDWHIDWVQLTLEGNVLPTELEP